ncbi:NlpC/P60 family protein [Paenibacillaceae bacterium]|nr:NlpC/P60 family protein [Paenibacillaceae bacterium]
MVYFHHIYQNYHLEDIMNNKKKVLKTILGAVCLSIVISSAPVDYIGNAHGAVAEDAVDDYEVFNELDDYEVFNDLTEEDFLDDEFPVYADASLSAISAFSAVSSADASISATISAKSDRVIASARSLQGKVRYKFGLNNPKTYTFDCSSFTKYVFGLHGVSLKWGSKAQSKQGSFVARKNLRKGDLIFMSVSTPGKINHVGIYMGNGQFIHNTNGGSRNGVTISNLNSSNYSKRYITARRVL